MPDMNELLKKFASESGNPQLTEQLRTALNSPKGQKAAQLISSQQATELEKAAKAAQNGDMSEVSKLMQQMMQTKEGANLAAQLKQLFGQ